MLRRVVWFLVGLVAVISIAVLAGCAKDNTRDTPPSTEVLTVTETRYVPIDKDYTAKCEWVADAPIELIFDVARGRKRCLEIYEANLDAIRKIQGTPTP